MNELLLSQPPLGTSKEGEPVWELAYFYPPQGHWTEKEYLALEHNRFLVEYDQGYLEFVSMPTREHQRIVLFLYRLIWSFLEAHNLEGEVLTAPLPVKLWEGKYREPDVVYLSKARSHQAENYPIGADLVIEVVSGGISDRYRDMVQKREEYAQAGIREYWIVDPEQEQITVLYLPEEQEVYTVHGEFGAGEQAASVLLDGLTVPVTAVFAAANI
ncbi:MAG: Uma2 family endonuclease [Chloroflexi bacterium]|nr:Uma2 family endonuclease [Chloroflexota bacterium]